MHYSVEGHVPVAYRELKVLRSIKIYENVLEVHQRRSSRSYDGGCSYLTYEVAEAEFALEKLVMQLDPVNTDTEKAFPPMIECCGSSC